MLDLIKLLTGAVILIIAVGSFAGLLVTGATALYCGFQRNTDVSSFRPYLAFDEEETRRADKLVIFIPGALNSKEIFGDADVFRENGFGVVYYLFPGMDGRPLDDCVDSNIYAERISRFAQFYPGKDLYLVGYSTGGQIAWRAKDLPGQRVKRVAILSTGTGTSDHFMIGLRTLGSLMKISRKISSYKLEDLWDAYYNTLLFGDEWYENPEVRARAIAIRNERRQNITTPTFRLLSAHIGWTMFQAPLPEAENNATSVRFYHGSNDVVFPFARVESVVSAIPGAGLETLEGQGHLIFATSDKLFPQILEFFS